MDCRLGLWTHFWKRNFTRRLPTGHPRLLEDNWDTRIRDGKDFEEKWEYVRNNPVRKGLVERAEDWPFQGVVYDWIYSGP